jgi:hypothetical protein
MVVIHENHLTSVEPSAYILHRLGVIFQPQVWIFIGIVFCATVCVCVCFDMLKDNQAKRSVRFFQKSATNWIFRIFGTGLGVQGIGKV